MDLAYHDTSYLYQRSSAVHVSSALLWNSKLRWTKVSIARIIAFSKHGLICRDGIHRPSASFCVHLRLSAVFNGL